jgi:hypothetical protein
MQEEPELVPDVWSRWASRLFLGLEYRRTRTANRLAAAVFAILLTVGLFVAIRAFIRGDIGEGFEALMMTSVVAFGLSLMTLIISAGLLCPNDETTVDEEIDRRLSERRSSSTEPQPHPGEETGRLSTNEGITGKQDPEPPRTSITE